MIYKGNQSKYFGAIIFETSLLLEGAALAIPPFVFVYSGKSKDRDLLRHEYGHLLQCLIFCIVSWSIIYGYIAYFILIGLPSLFSAYQASRNKTYVHQQFYTEKTANQLSFWLYQKPKDWNHSSYPVYWI